ncbi:hypothetical protein A5740_14335 [Mycobacterium sp. GA-1841]|uniref:hypothetical protein n=1 Tax=Mycobacterium sp. GA-1841 TaxID=1834154 RepID=UPI00096D85DB|nr:hypothetical protein [Mycobacterium sp. GA-1841]OMC31858.1 hypothetical protein A5740_14335 [Mycobacterium sp. GA-1841]
MEAAVRSYLTAGVALTGAAVIAVSPLAPTPTDIHLPAVPTSSAAVTLNALTNPLEVWAETLSTVGTNLQALGEQLTANPAPILQKVIDNQVGNATVVVDAIKTYGDALSTILQSLPENLKTAGDLIAKGEIVQAMDGLTQGLLPAIVGLLDLSNNTWSAVSTTTQNIQNVIKAMPTLVQSVALPALFPVLSVVNGLAATAEEVVKAANASDAEGVANALINAPAHLTDAFLNGKGTILGFINVPGVLSPTSPFGFLGSGPIASALDLPKTIADLLKPNSLAPKPTTKSAVASTAAVTALSTGVSARSVTLSLPAAGTTTDTTEAAGSAAPDTAAAAADDTTTAAEAPADTVKDTGTEADDSTDAATEAAAGADDSTTVQKSRINAKSTAKSLRVDIKDAAKRISAKFSGKDAKNASSTDGASTGSSTESSSAGSAGSAGSSKAAGKKHASSSKSHRKSRSSHD